MYQSFMAIIDKGKIKPLEKVHLKPNQQVIVTVVEDEYHSVNWDKFQAWVNKEKKIKRQNLMRTLRMESVT